MNNQRLYLSRMNPEDISNDEPSYDNEVDMFKLEKKRFSCRLSIKNHAPPPGNNMDEANPAKKPFCKSLPEL